MLKLGPAETIVCIGARNFLRCSLPATSWYSGFSRSDIKAVVVVLYFVTMVLLILPGIGVVFPLMFLNIRILPANSVFSVLICATY